MKGVIKKFDAQGRILIPKFIREQLNTEKVEIVLKEVDGKLVVELKKI